MHLRLRPRAACQTGSCCQHTRSRPSDTGDYKKPVVASADVTKNNRRPCQFAMVVPDIIAIAARFGFFSPRNSRAVSAAQFLRVHGKAVHRLAQGMGKKKKKKNRVGFRVDVAVKLIDGPIMTSIPLGHGVSAKTGRIVWSRGCLHATLLWNRSFRVSIVLPSEATAKMNALMSGLAVHLLVFEHPRGLDGLGTLVRCRCRRQNPCEY